MSLKGQQHEPECIAETKRRVGAGSEYQKYPMDKCIQTEDSDIRCKNLRGVRGMILYEQRTGTREGGGLIKCSLNSSNYEHHIKLRPCMIDQLMVKAVEPVTKQNPVGKLVRIKLKH